MNIVLYSTNCPKCKVLKSKLEQNNIEFIENNDIELMTQKGFTTAPMLEIDPNGTNEAYNWASISPEQLLQCSK